MEKGPKNGRRLGVKAEEKDQKISNEWDESRGRQRVTYNHSLQKVAFRCFQAVKNLHKITCIKSIRAHFYDRCL